MAEYRRLSTSRETLRTLDATFALVEKATGLLIRVRRGSIMVTKAPSWKPHARSWKVLSWIVKEGEGQALSRTREGPSLSTMRYRWLRAKWCLATLPRYLATDELAESQYSFLVDCLLLVFHQTYFALLPRLEKAELAEERDGLVSAFLAFAEHVPDIADRFRIMGLAHEARHDPASALASFERALAATHVDEHVFMTRLQTFWMVLMEKGDFTTGLQLLLKFVAMVPVKHLAELRELIVMTFEEYGEACERRAAG